MPAFSFIFDRRMQRGAWPDRFASGVTRIRSSGARSAPACGIVQFNQLFFRRSRASTHKHRTIRPCPAARHSAIRPRRAAPFYQGIPGIFLHFLRNNG
ncbi:hypothetical protein FCJ57_16425 [Burkholderia diffusa]|nr:hypothetical protein [Burkholderia diffusa]